MSIERAIDTRRILVFVSSTFRDLKQEREELAAHVFPRLRQFCRERAVVLTEIDLRWGITKAQSEDRQVLPRCFHEIDRCRPFFIGILGDRYGWVPANEANIPEHFLETHPWIRDRMGASVTELEFHHGVFNQYANKKYAWFYSKHPPGSGTPDWLPGHADEASQQNLETLKQSIRQSGCRFREGYHNARTLGDWLYQDLTDAISSLFPSNGPAAQLNEPLRHTNEARRYHIGFAGRTKERAELSRLLRRGRRVVVTGPSGSGKAAVLANWLYPSSDRSGQNAPAASNSWIARFISGMSGHQARPQLNLIRFAKLTDESSTPATLALSVISEVCERLEIQRALPQDSATALAELPSWLEEAGKLAAVRLVIAGLDKVETDPERALAWLPNTAATGISIIASVTTGSQTNDFAEYLINAGWLSLEVGEMTVDDCELAVEKTLKHYGKQVSEATQVLQRLASRMPRFVRTFLEAIRTYGQFGDAGEKLAARIDWYLASSNERELHERVIRRWQDDYERDRPGLVGDSLALLAAAHSGLEETEILEMLGDGERPLPRFLWTPLQASAETGLTSFGGLLQIGGGPFRDAICKLFMSDAATEIKVRGQLVEYLERQPVSNRHVDELLWQLAKLHRWDDLAAWLSDPRRLHRFWHSHEYVLKRHVVQLRDKAGIAITKLFQHGLTGDDVPLEAAITACQLMFDFGERTEVERLTFDMLRRRRELSDLEHRLLLSMRASVRMDDHPTEALELLKREEVICRREANDAALAACLGNQAIALRNLERFDEALTAHGLEERLCRKLRDLRLLVGSLSNQAQIRVLRAELPQAEAHLTELEHLARTLRDKVALGRCLETRGVCLIARRQHRTAADSFREAVEIFREAVDRRAHASCLRRLAGAHQLLGDLDSALGCLDEGLEIAQDSGDIELSNGIVRDRQQLLDQFVDRG